MIIRYKLIGRLAIPCDDPVEWAISFRDRHVAVTEVGCLTVSTVFLGFDHQMDDGPPLLFETMIFDGGDDTYQERCSTWAEAEAQHEEAVRIAAERVRLAGEVTIPGLGQGTPDEHDG